MNWIRGLLRRLFVPLPPVSEDAHTEEVHAAEEHSIEMLVRLNILTDELKVKRRER